MMLDEIMNMQRIESASGGVALGASTLTVFSNLMGWMTQNATFVGLMIALAGLLVQVAVARYNCKAKAAERRRREEEHELRMQILRKEVKQLEIPPSC